MQNNGKIQSMFIFLVILNCIVLLSMVTLSNLMYAQEIQKLHQKTLDEVSKHLSPSQNANIVVGNGPSAIGVATGKGKVYVTNSNDGTVSVINSINNTKIGNEIKVRDGPSAIGVATGKGKVYVANSNNDTVSVINEKNNAKIVDIKVGNGPFAIGVASDKVYVANYLNNTVSVINEKNNAKIVDIKVGNGPFAIGVAPDKVYVANYLNNTVSVINSINNTKIGNDIKVGNKPFAVGLAPDIGKVYVANSGDNTVSVIDEKNNTKIADIKVGNGPWAIGVAPDKVYIANQYSNTVSVIDEKNNTKIADIKVGKAPLAMGLAPGNVSVANSDDSTLAADGAGVINTIYVANSLDKTVSVIDEKNNTKIGNDIKVGYLPKAIGVDALTNTIYVANSGDNTVSVIDEKANKVVAGAIFNVKPISAGRIECDKNNSIAPLGQQFYLWSGSECVAKPNQGFEFVSWQENLRGNSTQLLKVATTSSFFDPVLNILHLMSDKPESTLNITKFGSFTANFRALPPAIPPEYVATLFAIVATAFVGSWLIPTVIGWIGTKKQGSRLDHYHNEAKTLYDDGKLDKNDIEKLNHLRDVIADEYTRGKINKEQYDRLGDEISISYSEIFTKEIDSLKNLPGNNKTKLLSGIIADIDDTYFKKRINNEYYARLKKEISVVYQEIFKKKIDSLENLSGEGKVTLLETIRDEISDAYSKEMINELHYSLLKEKISNYENPRG